MFRAVILCFGIRRRIKGLHPTNADYEAKAELEIGFIQEMHPVEREEGMRSGEFEFVAQPRSASLPFVRQAPGMATDERETGAACHCLCEGAPRGLPHVGNCY